MIASTLSGQLVSYSISYSCAKVSLIATLSVQCTDVHILIFSFHSVESLAVHKGSWWFDLSIINLGHCLE